MSRALRWIQSRCSGLTAFPPFKTRARFEPWQREIQIDSVFLNIFRDMHLNGKKLLLNIIVNLKSPTIQEACSWRMN
jgi:hypothetical protein